MTKSSKRAAKSAPAPAQPEAAQSKIQQVVAMLRRPEGARIEDVMTLTGWQAHSVRGAFSGAIKKNLGLTITSEKVEGARTYRIVEPAE